MTLDEIEAQVLRELGDLNALEVFWTQSDIQNWIYEAELRISRKAELLEHLSEVETSVADQINYSAPVDKISIQRITFDGYIIENIEFDELASLDERPTSTASTTIPQYWYFRDEEINFYPAPAETGKTIGIYYSNYPTKLTTGASSPTVPPEYHPYLVTYCLARGKEMEEETQDAIYFMSKFESELAEIDFERSVGQSDSYSSVRLAVGDDW